MVEELLEQIEKADVMFDYIQEQTNDEKETGIICTKLGLDNPHISRQRTLENYKQLADKMINLRKILRSE